MNKVKIAYDWWGPMGPLTNNSVPTIEQLAMVSGNLNFRKLIDRFAFPNVIRTFFSQYENFEFAPSSEITDKDVFLYEYQYYWRVPIDKMTMPNYGMIEQSLMPANILKNIRFGKGYILLENTAEAYLYWHDIEKLHIYFQSWHIPFNKIIYQTGCPNSTEVYKKICDEHQVPDYYRMNVIYLDWVEFNLSKHLQNNKSQLLKNELKKDFSEIKYDFLSFNRRFRNHRVNLLIYFYKNNLLSKSLFSMPAIDPDNHVMQWKQRAKMSAFNEANISQDDINNIQAMLPLKFDEIDDFHQMVQDEMLVLKPYYNSCLISLVTETHFDTDIISTTEKTFKPIKYKHPFIIVGAPYSLKYLQKFGYKTFSDFFDESYDEIEDHRIRLLKIVDLCVEISNWSTDKKREFYENVKSITAHNFNVLLNKYPTNSSCEFWRTFPQLHYG